MVSMVPLVGVKSKDNSAITQLIYKSAMSLLGKPVILITTLLVSGSINTTDCMSLLSYSIHMVLFYLQKEVYQKKGVGCFVDRG